jgi:hypothetical protein
MRTNDEPAPIAVQPPCFTKALRNNRIGKNSWFALRALSKSAQRAQ